MITHLSLIIASIFATNGFMMGLAVAMVIGGWVLKYWLNSRKFYRRNGAGLEGFSSYSNFRLISLLEGIARLIGNILIIVGVILFALFWITIHWQHK